MKKNVFLNGSLQFFVTTTILSVISIYLLNIEVKQAIIISAGLSLSSTAIILKLLNESGDIKKEY
jgi:CPA2 family monovalent cation:H+ antiporter-2